MLRHFHSSKCYPPYSHLFIYHICPYDCRCSAARATGFSAVQGSSCCDHLCLRERACCLRYSSVVTGMATNVAASWQKVVKLLQDCSTIQTGSAAGQAAVHSVERLIIMLHQTPTPPKAVWKKLLQLQVCCARVLPLLRPISSCWCLACSRSVDTESASNQTTSQWVTPAMHCACLHVSGKPSLQQSVRLVLATADVEC